MSRNSNLRGVAAEDELLTVSDIAKHCQVSERTVRRWIADGHLMVARLGRLIRIRRSDFCEFLDENC